MLNKMNLAQVRLQAVAHGCHQALRLLTKLMASELGPEDANIPHHIRRLLPPMHSPRQWDSVPTRWMFNADES